MTLLSAMDAISPPVTGDLFYIVTDPAGTPVDKKVTIDILADFIYNDQKDNIKTYAYNNIVAETTTTRTLVLTDAEKFIKCSNAGATTVTIPLNASVAFIIGTEIEIYQYGAGTITISPATGVTMRSKDSATDHTAQYTSSALKKIATDEWVLIGDVE